MLFFLVFLTFTNVLGLDKCVCPSYQKGAEHGSEMCEFHGMNCALASKFADGCPEKSITCDLDLSSKCEEDLDCYTCIEAGAGACSYYKGKCYAATHLPMDAKADFLRFETDECQKECVKGLDCFSCFTAGGNACAYYEGECQSAQRLPMDAKWEALRMEIDECASECTEGLSCTECFTSGGAACAYTGGKCMDIQKLPMDIKMDEVAMESESCSKEMEVAAAKKNKFSNLEECKEDCKRHRAKKHRKNCRARCREEFPKDSLALEALSVRNSTAILAIIGVIAILYQATRLVGKFIAPNRFKQIVDQEV